MAVFRLEKVAKLILNHQVVMFSKSFCPFCLKAKATLKGSGVVDMKVIELDDDINDGDSIQVFDPYESIILQTHWWLCSEV